MNSSLQILYKVLNKKTSKAMGGLMRTTRELVVRVIDYSASENSTISVFKSPLNKRLRKSSLTTDLTKLMKTFITNLC